MIKVSIFYYYLTCHGNEWACSKEKKILFYFLIKIKIKSGKSMFSNCIQHLGHKKNQQQQQTKKNQGKNKQIKNGNNSTHHEPLSEEWIGLLTTTKKIFSVFI